jgi:hypothetical protein
MRAHWLIVPLLAGLGGLSSAADVAAPTEIQRIKRLVDLLGSPRFAEREAAARVLDNLGAPALDALKKAAAGDEPETRRRAQDLIGRIEGRLLRERLLKPTGVRLVCRDVPLASAVETLAKKSGHAIVLAGDGAQLRQRKIALDTGETSFWQALDQLRRTAGLEEDDQIEVPLPVETVRWMRGGALRPLPPRLVSAEPGPIVLKDGKVRDHPVHYAGAARVRVVPANASIQGSPQEKGEIIFCLETSLEPRVILEHTSGAQIDKAVDDQGQELRPSLESDPAAPFGEPVFIAGHNGLPRAVLGTGAQQAAVRLQAGARPARSIKELRGRITVEVRTAPQAILEVGNVLDATGKAIKGRQGASVTLTDIEKLDAGHFVLRLDLQPAAGNANQLFSAALRGRFGGLPLVPELPAGIQAQMQQGCGALIAPPGGVLADPMGLSLVDDQGRPFQLIDVPRRRSTITNNGVVHELTLHFKPNDGQSQPAKLVYSTMRVVTLEIPFVLKDIPLP